MRIADLSVQKIANSAFVCDCGKTHAMESQIIYCPLKNIGEKLAQILVDYKLLYITDDPKKTALAASLGKNVTTVVIGDGEDVSRLFALSDGINIVCAYGGDYALSAAKYFATVRNIKSCALVFSCDCAAIVKRKLTVNVLGEDTIYPARDFNFIFFDSRSLFRDNLKDVYISSAAVALSLLEVSFSCAVLGKEPVCPQLYELAYEAFLRLCGIDREYNPALSLFEQNFRLNYCLREGFPLTESGYVMGCLKPEEKYSAFEKLVDIYDIFFRYGKMRRYSAADYFSRMRAAANLKRMSVLDISLSCYIPSVEELNSYSLRFEQCRSHFAAFADDLKRRKGQILNCYLSFGGAPVQADVGAQIYSLPETSGVYGIISLMRDFGLLEIKKT